MKISKGTANLLLAIGIFMLVVWLTRLVVFFGELQAGTLPVPAVHFGLIVVSLAVGFYLSYLGVRSRREIRRAR